MNIGLIGAGNIGATAARLFLDAGHAVALSNSRGPDTLQALVDDLGGGAQALPVEEAAAFGDLVMEAIPYGHVDALPGNALTDTLLVSASNYFAHRDGEVDFEGRSHTGRVAALHPGARVVKAFNTIYWEDLRDQADASLPIEERRVIPLAGDDAPAKETVSALIEEIGFAALDVGGLEAGGRLMQPGQPLYNEALTRPEARRRIQQAGAEG